MILKFLLKEMLFHINIYPNVWVTMRNTPIEKIPINWSALIIEEMLNLETCIVIYFNNYNVIRIRGLPRRVCHRHPFVIWRCVAHIWLRYIWDHLDAIMWIDGASNKNRPIPPYILIILRYRKNRYMLYAIWFKGAGI